MRAILLWSLFVAACLLRAQSNARIEGRVVDQSGQGVRKAIVRLQTRTASTDQHLTSYVEVTEGNGGFTFENLSAGQFSLTAERSGFINVGGLTEIFLQTGEAKSGVQVKMTAQASINGRVLDQDGDPVGNAQVRVIRFQYLNGRKQTQSAALTSTDDQGNFRLGNITPGRYYLVADDLVARSIHRNANERAGRSAQEINVITYYPSGPDLQRAALITLAAGTEMRGADIRMRRSRVYSIRGKIVPAPTEGQPIPNIWIAPKGDSGVQSDRMDGPRFDDGMFEFNNLVPGAYIIQATPADYIRGPNGEPQQTNLAGRLEVSIGSTDLDNVTFTLSPAAEITGSISMEDGSPLALEPYRGARSGGVPPGTPAPPRRSPRIALLDYDGLGTSPNAQVNEDGTFRIGNVGLSRYLVNLNALSAGVFIKSLSFAGQDITNTPLDATSGAGGVLKIVLSRKSAEVSFTVRDDSGNPKTGIRITLWQESPRVHDPGAGIMNLTSTAVPVVLLNLVPGDYFVAAWEQIDSNLVQDPEFLAKMESEATHLALSEGAKESLDLKIIPRDKILGEAVKMQ